MYAYKFSCGKKSDPVHRRPRSRKVQTCDGMLAMNLKRYLVTILVIFQSQFLAFFIGSHEAAAHPLSQASPTVLNG